MKKLVFVILAIILALGITGCGMSAVTPTSVPMTTHATVTQTKGSYGLEDSSGSFNREDGSGQVIVQQPPAPTTITPGKDTSSGYATTTERMVIKTASMALVVEDVNNALQQIAFLANANGGFVINSDMREDKSRLYASISFKVEASKFTDTIQALRNLAVDVRSESTSGQDVTEEYVDLDAQLRNLEASEAQLLALMEKAGSVKDILEVQQQLTNTRGQIEQIKGRMQFLRESTALSSLYVSLEQSKLTVEFSASATSVKEGDDVYFSPVISGGFEPYSFEWDFGDGKTSTEGAPKHSYKNSGTYTVKLTIKDDKGATTDKTRKEYITVLTGWDAGNVASSAWSGLVAFGRFLLSFIIWIGILSPIWIVVLVILYFTIWRKRKKKS